MKVLELMKTHVISTSPEATLRDAVDLFDLYQVSGLPVVGTDGQLAGVITEFDVIHALLPEFIRLKAAVAIHKDSEALVALVEKTRSTSVAEAMSSPAVSLDENSDVLDAAALMLSRKFKRLPVTSEGRLAGIISRIDICQAVLEGQL